MSRGARTDIEAVEAANTALYDAVEHADLEALQNLWMDDGISVVQAVESAGPAGTAAPDQVGRQG